MRARSVVAGAMVLAVIAGCADLLGFKTLETPDGGSSSDSGIDVDTCNHATWASAPDAESPGGDPDGGGPYGYVVAVRDVHFTSLPDGGDHIGYDLDHRCTTNDPSTNSCSLPSTETQTTIVDGPDGVDQQSLAVLTVLKTLTSAYIDLGDDAFNAIIAQGEFTVVFRLLGYKGVANQATVLVAMQGSPGIGSGKPAFDGNDAWNVAREDTVNGSLYAPALSTNGYVNNFHLVAAFGGQATLRLLLPQPVDAGASPLGGLLTLTLSDPVLTGTLVKRADGHFDLVGGVVAGRWAANDALAAVGGLNLSGAALCTNTLVFPTVAGKVCGFRDINDSTSQDNMGMPCTDISVALGFDAVAATLANAVDYPDAGAIVCPDAGTCAP